MDSRFLSAAAVSAVLAVTSCVSAGDRLRQGRELEAQGRHYQAALRYADALDKDDELDEARVRLMEVGTTALEQGLAAAERDLARGDPVGAAQEYRRLDELLGTAGAVGVFLPSPDDYRLRRGQAFAGAVEVLLEEGARATRDGRYAEARRIYRSIRAEYDPPAEQLVLSLEGEARTLLAWARWELEEGLVRSSFQRAGEAMELAGADHAELQSQARRLRSRALELGTVGLAVLPVTATEAVRERAGPELEIHLADVLELAHLRRPPPFIAVVDPVAVRQEVREASRPGEPLRPFQVERILARVGADYGALVEVVEWTESEVDVESFTRETRSRRGRPVTFRIEQGELVLRGAAEVILVDGAGRRLEATTVHASASGPFERGVYRGNPEQLRLSRNELRYFDAAIQAEQRRQVRDELVEELAAEVASRIFSRLLDGIP